VLNLIYINYKLSANCAQNSNDSTALTLNVAATLVKFAIPPPIIRILPAH